MICEAFSRTAHLCLAMHAHPANKHAGCWEVSIDANWWISFNGHDHPIRNSHGAEVPAFSCAVEFNGWPAGIFGPYGGMIAAGDCANEDAFLAAIEARIAEETR